MISFRYETARRLGLDLIVLIKQDGVKRGISPIASRFTAPHPGDEDRESLRQALDLGCFDAAFGGARRDEEKSRAKEHFSRRASLGRPCLGPTQPASGTVAPVRTPASAKADRLKGVFPLSNWTELDVWEYVLAENIPGCAALFLQASSRR